MDYGSSWKVIPHCDHEVSKNGVLTRQCRDEQEQWQQIESWWYALIVPETIIHINTMQLVSTLQTRYQD